MSIQTCLRASILFLSLFSLPAVGETVFVKYRGPVDLAPFDCESVTRSSFVRRVCYDVREHYMIINLNGIYYHYCAIPAKTVQSLLYAESMGHYYNSSVKGQYDCRINRMPAYGG